MPEVKLAGMIEECIHFMLKESKNEVISRDSQRNYIGALIFQFKTKISWGLEFNWERIEGRRKGLRALATGRDY